MTESDDNHTHNGIPIDVNNDGNVDILDSAMIEKYVVEKISDFPKKG